MSEDKSRKTEKPTPHKLREARKKGQVPRSREIVSTIMLLVAAVAFWVAWGHWFALLEGAVTAPADLYGLPFRDAFGRLWALLLHLSFYLILLPFAALLFVAAVVGNVIQFGVLFSTEPIKPSLQKINPVEGFKRIFSVKSLLETGLSVLKVAGIGLVIYGVIRASLPELLHEVTVCDVPCLKGLMEVLVRRLFLFVLPLLLVLMLLDYLIQKTRFLIEQRMSRDELKREFRDTEGDPLVKGQRRALQRELGADDLRERIRAARVLVADVDRVVVLRYDPEETPLPVILAVGRDAMARRMTEVARAEGVPVVAQPALARLLAESGAIDQYIPEPAIQPTALLLRRVLAGGR